MRRHHTGSGRRAVIPSGWAAHHRPVAAASHTATVQLRHPGGTQTGELDDETGTWQTAPHEPYYEGPARIQVLPAGEQDRAAGEQEVTTLGYAVQLDHDVTDMQLHDLCKVIAVDTNGDTWLVDRVLTVEAMESGSLHWERRLLCSDSLETQEA